MCSCTQCAMGTDYSKSLPLIWFFCFFLLILLNRPLIWQMSLKYKINQYEPAGFGVVNILGLLQLHRSKKNIRIQIMWYYWSHQRIFCHVYKLNPDKSCLRFSNLYCDIEINNIEVGEKKQQTEAFLRKNGEKNPCKISEGLITTTDLYAMWSK